MRPLATLDRDRRGARSVDHQREKPVARDQRRDVEVDVGWPCRNGSRRGRRRRREFRLMVPGSCQLTPGRVGDRMNREAGVRRSVQPPDAQDRIRDRTARATDVEAEERPRNGGVIRPQRRRRAVVRRHRRDAVAQHMCICNRDEGQAGIPGRRDRGRRRRLRCVAGRIHRPHGVRVERVGGDGGIRVRARRRRDARDLSTVAQDLIPRDANVVRRLRPGHGRAGAAGRRSDTTRHRRSLKIAGRTARTGHRPAIEHRAGSRDELVVSPRRVEPETQRPVGRRPGRRRESLRVVIDCVP